MKNYPCEAKNVCKILSAPFPFFALMAGVQLGVFVALKDKPMNVEQIADAIGANPIKLKSLLYALVIAKLLAVEKGEFFSNTSEANQFLIPESPSYMCDHVHYNVHPLMLSWMMSGGIKLSESIRTGKPQINYDFSALSEDELTKGFRATHPIALRAGSELATKYDFSSYHTLADVGGGVGGLAIAITEIYPNLKATVVELPKITPITQRFVDEAQAADRVQVIAANLIHDSLEGSYDVAVLRALIQILSQDDAIKVLRNTYKIINPGGIIYILGHILDDSRTTPIEEVWYSIININFYDIPGSYTEGEYSNWLMEAGFVQIERGFLPNGDGVMIARKPVG